MCYNNVQVDGVEALCTILKRFTDPCRFIDIIQILARPGPQLSIICSQVTSFMYKNRNYLLSNLSQPRLSPLRLQGFCDTIYQKGTALSHCQGFVDGRVWSISRPNENQRILYNGHKKVHAIKFQSVIAPNGLVANFVGRLKGSGMLAMPGLLDAI